jgi:hypothetical protein
MSGLASMSKDRSFGFVIDDGFSAHLLNGAWHPGLLNGCGQDKDLLAIPQIEADDLIRTARAALNQPVRSRFWLTPEERERVCQGAKEDLEVIRKFEAQKRDGKSPEKLD